jgi:hypothetical protein
MDHDLEMIREHARAESLTKSLLSSSCYHEVRTVANELKFGLQSADLRINLVSNRFSDITSLFQNATSARLLGGWSPVRADAYHAVTWYPISFLNDAHSRFLQPVLCE